MTTPFSARTPDMPTLQPTDSLSLFSLAPQMDYVPSPEMQEAVLQALKAKSPHLNAQFKRFSSRAFKRLSLKDAEALMLDLVQDAYLADVVHLHLDWFCYLGRFSQYQAMGLWMHLFQLFRDKPLLLFGHEVPTFLSNPLMVKERAIWQQWCEHFKETPHHHLILHQPSMKTAWLDVGFPEERLLILPKLLHLKEKQATFPIQPKLFHTVKQRFQQGQKQVLSSSQKSQKPYILGFMPDDEDNDSLFCLKEALLKLPENVVLLVMGGTDAKRPAFRWEQALLDIIQANDLGHRVLITGAVQAEEASTYLNVCDAVYLAHRHQSDDLQQRVYQVLHQNIPLFLPADSETVQGLAMLFQDAWQKSDITHMASSQDLVDACLRRDTTLKAQKHEGLLLQSMGLEVLLERYLNLYARVRSSQHCNL